MNLLLIGSLVIYEVVSGATKCVDDTCIRQLAGTTSSAFTVTSSSLFGISAPLQCLGGTFCGLRAGSPSGSGICPAGFSCPSGSTEPVLAPLGQFVGGAGSVQAYNCSSNTFAPSQGSGVCLPCPPGFSCTSAGTVHPSICAPGTYRYSMGSASVAGTTANIQVAIQNSVSCNSCPAGTFSFLRGAPSVFNCEPCPSGRVCPAKTANITQSDACGEGFICAEGTSLDVATSYICEAGYVCSKGSTPKTVYSNLCPKGYVCDKGTTFANQYRTRCPVGFYCPHGTPWSSIMQYTQQPGIGYLSRGQFYVLQIAGQYCLRQYMLSYKEAAVKVNAASIQAGKGPLTGDQTALIVSRWTEHIVDCLQTQSDYLTKLNKQNVPVSGRISQDVVWHMSNLLSAAVVGKRFDKFTNKCDATQFPRVDGPNTAWDCMCTNSYKEGSLIKCLTNTAASLEANNQIPRIGAPFNFDDLNTIDSETVCTKNNLAWPDCLDWSRINNFATKKSPSEMTFANALVSGRSDHLGSNESSNLRRLGAAAVTSSSGPSTGGVYDDFDSMSLPFMDYVTAALMRNYLLFAAQGNDGSTSFTQCPLGTLTATDGIESIEGCVPRVIIPSVNDPDKIVVARVNPINVPLSNVAPRLGFPKKFEEDQKMVFDVPARSFVTLTFDYRDLGEDFEYGIDWRIVFLISNTLNPDEDIPQQCYDILNGFVNYQYAVSRDATLSNLYTGAARQMNLDRNGCTLVMNPTPFEAFQYASSSTLCPAPTPECYLRTLNTRQEVNECNSAGGPVNVHEFYIHPLVDIQLRIEVQILNGVYQPDRFRLIKTMSVEVSTPSRAVMGTTKAFVVNYPSSLAQYIFPAYNLPLVPLTQAQKDAYATKSPGYVTMDSNPNKKIPANSQQGIMTKSTLSWLPRNDQQVPLANCMRNPKMWEEFLYSNDGYFGNYNPRSDVYMTHIPFLSNCRGYGNNIPLWHITENSPGCVNLPANETKPISEFSFGADSIGDSCDGVIQLECMVDEVLNDKKPIPRWFELQTGSIMFYISAHALSNEEYANVTSDNIGKLIPVVLVQANPFDGTWMKTVSLDLGYWQSSSDVKILAEASITFDDFQQLTDDQARGTEPWVYNLKVNWYPLKYIDAFNVYAFPVWLYALVPAVIGLFIWLIMGLNWLFHWWAAGNMRVYAAKLTDKRYWRLVYQSMSKGYILAAIPCVVIFFVLVITFVGETNLFTVSVLSCDESDTYGCRVGLLDPLPSSWSGESLSDPKSYRIRRLGRTGTLLVVMGSYFILSGIRGFFPNLSSHYYDAERNKSEEEREAARNWPPDQESFVPLIWKRSTYFLLIGGVCVLFQLIIQFSYSTYTSWGWWKYMLLFYLITKMIGWVTVGMLNEEILKIPLIAASQTNMELTAIGSNDCFTYITTAFLMNAIYMVDRLYVVPHEAKFVAITGRKLKRMYRSAKNIFSGGRSAIPETDPADDNENNDLNDGNVNSLTQVGTRAPSSSSDQAGMMRFLSCYVSSQLTTFFGLLQFFLAVVFYDSTQSMNYQDVPYSTANYYVLLHLVLLPFRYLLDVLVLNTAELFYGWRILDYLEYCRYRFVVRPNKWKGVGEIADELIEPDLRSLDLYCFSSQLYFICFVIVFGAILLSMGLQVLINNAWDLFTDQATPFIIIGGIFCMVVIEVVCRITAEYLGIWSTSKPDKDVQGRSENGAAEPSKEDEYESIIGAGAGDAFNGTDKVHLKAPVGSILYNWPEPSPGDKAGWDRYRAAYLKENQLWLQAHMDSLIDSQTTIDYRRKLMDSLAKVLKESNLIEIQKQQQKALRGESIGGDVGMSTARSTERSGEGGSVGQASSSLEKALELSAVPMHEIAVAELATTRELYRGTAIELATQTLLDRGRFLRFLSDSVIGLNLAQATRLLDFCETCGNDSSAGLSLTPQYPVSYVADQFRIQRGYPDTWNVPLWQQYYHQFTPVCTICNLCRAHYEKTNYPIQIGEFMGSVARPAEAGEEIIPCEQVLRETYLRLPSKPLSVEASTMLNHWFDFANVVGDPRSSKNQLDSALVRAGYKLSAVSTQSTQRGPEVPRNPFANTRVDVSPEGRAMLRDWASRGKQNM